MSAQSPRPISPSPDETPEIWRRSEVLPLIERLIAVRGDMLALESGAAGLLEAIPPDRRDSARNLLHYVALRRHDIRPLQDELVPRGLSSLGRCEANVHATLNSVIAALCRLSGMDESPGTAGPAVSFSRSRSMLDRATADLLGPRPVQGGAHIMITMPSEAADSPELISELVAHGMDCMRVNCAHDDATAWGRMIEHLRQACHEQRRSCKVLMDLGGPKLRTGPLAPGPAVIKWRPRRNPLGQVVAPATVWLCREDHGTQAPLPFDATIPVVGDWLAEVQVGDEIHLRDARGRARRVRIRERRPEGVWGESRRTAYITPGTRLRHKSHGRLPAREPGRVGEIAPAEQYLMLAPGDRFLLGDNHKIGAPACHDEHGGVVRPATIGCTLPSVFRDLRRGDRVLLDDGKIAARVEDCQERHVVLEVTHAGEGGAKLRADKGINLPDTNLRLDALTDKDLADLDFVVQHADIVGYSFVRRAEDVWRLQEELARRGRAEMPIVLKVENRQAFEHLPSLLMAALRSPASGVMIARGDLAVELGWQRLAEAQEEILWMCEAAHLPVIWATQVLDELARTGTPTRAEITDAAMSVRAECVMLNKGPYVLEAMRVLGDILRRMQDHQVKKRTLLRRLRLADDLLPQLAAEPPTVDAG